MVKQIVVRDQTVENSSFDVEIQLHSEINAILLRNLYVPSRLKRGIIVFGFYDRDTASAGMNNAADYNKLMAYVGYSFYQGHDEKIHTNFYSLTDVELSSQGG